MAFKIKEGLTFGQGTKALTLRRALKTEALGLYIDGPTSVESGRLALVDGTGAPGGGYVYNEEGEDINFRWEGDNEVNLLVLDAGTDTAAIGGAVAAGVQLAITLDTTGTTFNVLSLTGADAALGADGDETFLTFLMRDEEVGITAPAEIGRISAIYINAEAADDGSLFSFDTFVANALTEVLRVGQNAAADATSQLLTLQGTTLLPCYAEIGDPNTGMNLDGADGIELVTGGAAELTLTTTSGVFAGTLTSTGDFAVTDGETNLLNSTAATASLVVTNRVADNTWQVLDLVGDNIADGSDNDEIVIRFQMMDDGTPVLDTFAEIAGVAVDVSTAGDADGMIVLRALKAGTTTDVLRAGYSVAGAEAYGFFGSYAALTGFATSEASLQYTLSDTYSDDNVHQTLSALLTELLAHGVITAI
jgi:hypothetical protein